MKYEEFKNLKSTEKWFYMWTALENHLGQVKEIKWVMRVIGAGIIIRMGYWIITKQ